MADEQQEENLTAFTKSHTISHENTTQDSKRSPVSVTAVGPNQFCDPCIRTFLEQEKLGSQFDDEHVVEHHGSIDGLNLAVACGCPLCGRTFSRLLENGEFLAAYDTQKDFPNTKIRISAVWRDFSLSHKVDWEASHEAEGHEKSSGTVEVTFRRVAINELEAGESIVKRASVPLSNPHQEYSNTSSIDINSWLKVCTKHHLCSKDTSPEYLPPRLLDCSERNLRLVEAFTIRESHGTVLYATLSHCWGTTAANTILDSDNINQFYAELRYSTLPKTFKDAIKIVKRLGLSFLWIDSLCIIQKGPRHKTDWEMHVREMADIYSNGFINIAASWSPNSTGGCFYPRMPGLSRACIANIEGTLELYEEWNYGMTNMFHLNSRAWVFQERIMSPRVIHYNENDVFWDCNELFASSKFPKGLPQLKTQFSTIPVFQLPYGNERHWQLPESKSDAQVHWLSLVRAYIQCNITRPEDRLPAMSAIARQINETYIHEEYVAGFFRSNLPAGLLWAAGIGQPVHRPDNYVAPSWSWASVHGRIFVVPDQADDFVIPYAKVKSISIELIDPQNPYGQIKTGSMLIEGSILKAVGNIQESEYHFCDLELPRIELQSEVLIRFLWDRSSSSFLEGEECLLLCIGERTLDGEYQGLIISPVRDGADPSKPLFSRTGFWSLQFSYAEMNVFSGEEEIEKGKKSWKKSWKKTLKKVEKKIKKNVSIKDLEQAFWGQLQNYVQNELEEITLI